MCMFNATQDMEVKTINIFAVLKIFLLNLALALPNSYNVIFAIYLSTR